MKNGIPPNYCIISNLQNGISNIHNCMYFKGKRNHTTSNISFKFLCSTNSVPFSCRIICPSLVQWYQKMSNKAVPKYTKELIPRIIKLFCTVVSLNVLICFPPLSPCHLALVLSPLLLISILSFHFSFAPLALTSDLLSSLRLRRPSGDCSAAISYVHRGLRAVLSHADRQIASTRPSHSLPNNPTTTNSHSPPSSSSSAVSYTLSYKAERRLVLVGPLQPHSIINPHTGLLYRG